MVTPVGAWRLTDVLDRYRAQPLAAWTKRTSRDLCPDAAPNDPAMFLVLEPDGSLPPAPTKYSGRLSEWRDLKDSDAYLEARYGLRPVAKKPVQDHLGANG
jgi:hypothetical protein